MNKFIKNKSLVSQVTIYLCIIALFADGTNLTDLFSAVTTIHFEEVNESAINDGMIWTTNIQSTILQNVAHNSTYTKDEKSVLRLIILDQDSVSFAADPIFTERSFSITPNLEYQTNRPLFLSESLYLRNCNFLL